jgi:hypothetical protein
MILSLIDIGKFIGGDPYIKTSSFKLGSYSYIFKYLFNYSMLYSTTISQLLCSAIYRHEAG